MSVLLVTLKWVGICIAALVCSIVLWIWADAHPTDWRDAIFGGLGAAALYTLHEIHLKLKAIHLTLLRDSKRLRPDVNDE